MENALDSLTPANLRMKGGWFGIDPESPGGPLAILERSVCQRGSWGADLYLPVQPGDLVIPKTRYSSFIGTTLADDLRMRDLQTLAVCGVVTNQCVESTVRDAYQLDFDVVLVDDCCAAGSVDAHNATLANVRSSFGRVLDSGALLTAWREFSSVS
jgi:ureidoacrylate peracid hydrolase